MDDNTLFSVNTMGRDRFSSQDFCLVERHVPGDTMPLCFQISLAQ
jgi:hypothetical protein